MITNLTLYCIVNRKKIPHERAIKKSNTCCDACAKILKAKRRALVDQRRCRVCNKPSTPEERKAYQAFLRANPEFKTAKLGRPRKKKEPPSMLEKYADFTSVAHLIDEGVMSGAK